MVAPKRLVTVQRYLLALVLICLLGCNSFNGAGIGVGRRPIPDYIAPITFTDTEKTTLDASLKGDLRDKLLQLHADYAGMLQERNTEADQAISINGAQLVRLNGYSHAETVKMLRASLLMHNWPAESPLMVGLDKRDFKE